MKSSSRKFLRCMFCDSDDPVTPEHIFGAALSRKFKDQPVAAVSRTGAALPRGILPQEAEKRFYRSSGMQPLSFTSHSMCRSCNGELGKELTKLTHVLENFFKGRTNRISDEHCRLALRYFQRIGILVDLEASAFDPLLMIESAEDIASNQSYGRSPSYLSLSEREAFRAGALLSDVNVFLGRHKGTHGRGFSMNVARFGDEHYASGDKKGLWSTRFVFSIMQVTCMVNIGRNLFNKNEKLQLFRQDAKEFRLDITKVSSNEDILKNYASFTTHLDGTITPFNANY